MSKSKLKKKLLLCIVAVQSISHNKAYMYLCLGVPVQQDLLYPWRAICVVICIGLEYYAAVPVLHPTTTDQRLGM